VIHGKVGDGLQEVHKSGRRSVDGIRCEFHLLLVGWFMLSCFSCLAQNSKPTALPAETAAAQPLTGNKVPLIAQQLRLSDFVPSGDTMEPTPGLATQLTHLRSFIQSNPEDGRPATEQTDVYLARTTAALTFVFVCRDHHPESIRTHLARRENILKDDTVSVLLDPFQDHRRGILFTVNPSGVQADAAWTENNNPDYSFDQVWDSDARITRTGWLALISIPYRSLRFRPGPGGWGVVFQRSFPRNSETDWWPRIAANISGVLTQESTLRGIEGVTGSHNLQINPYAIAQNQHTLNTLDPLNPFFSSRHLEGTAGGDVKAILKDSIILDATVNPDFSQVESDQPQFTVNQRFPVYFPELRPFFLENANYFATPINLLYTRNIVHPEFGARLTGKLGSTNLGLLAIDDRAPGEVFTHTNPLYGTHALFAVGRLSQDLGKGSSLGAIYTDEEFAGSFNRIGGLDFTARFNDRWNAQGQIVESSTRTLNLPNAPSTYAAGPGSNLELTRSGHSFNFDDTYYDFSTGFVTQVGYLQTANIRSDNLHTNYQWFPKHSVLQSWGIETSDQFAFDHFGNRVYHYSTVDPFFTLARKTTIAPLLGANSDTLTPAQYPLLRANRNITENFGGLVFRSAPLAQINFNIVYTHGGNPNYNPANGIPSLLHEDYLQAFVTLQPLRSLTLDNTYLLDRNRAHGNEHLAFENQTLRTKINYQFTRAFSARVIVEYDSLLVNPAQVSLLRTKQVGTQALITWLPHPGTAIYLGYNNDLQNLDRGFCNRVLAGPCDPNNSTRPRSPNYLNDGRQIFLKASYLLRF